MKKTSFFSFEKEHKFKALSPVGSGEHLQFITTQEKFNSKEKVERQNQNQNFYHELFTHAEKNIFKEFFTEMMDLKSKESLENFEDLHRKFLFEDFRNYFNHKNNKFFKNAIKNYFSIENCFPALKPTNTICQEGHSKRLTALILSRDSKTLITGSEDASIRIWEIDYKKKNFKIQGILWGHKSRISALAIDNDCTMLFSGGEDHIIRMWDFISKETIGILRGHIGEIKAMCLTKNELYLVSACRKNLLIVWDLERKEQKQQLYGHNDLVSAIETTTKFIFSASFDKTIRVWNSKNFKEIKVLSHHQEKITQLSIDSSFNIMVSGSLDLVFMIWNIQNLTLLRFLKANNLPDKILITPDAKMIVSLTKQVIRIWNISDLEEEPSESEINFKNIFEGTMAVTADSKNVFACLSYEDGDSICCVSLNPLKIERFNHPNSFNEKNIKKTSMNFTADSKFLFWAEKSLIKIWNLQENKMEKELDEQDEYDEKEQEINFLIGSKDSTKLACGNKDGTISIWDFVDGKKILEIKKNCDFKAPMIFANDSKTIFFNNKNNEISVWDIDSNKKLPVSFLLPKKSQINCLILSSDAKTIFLGCDDGLNMIDYNSKKIERIYEKCIKKMTIIDESYMISFSPGSVVKWNIITKEKMTEIPVKVNKDFSLIAASKNFIIYVQNKLKIIDFNENCLGFLSGHSYKNYLNTLLISPDGNIVTAKNNADESVYIWILNKNERLPISNGHISPIKKIFTLNNLYSKQIISIDSNFVLKRWNFKTKALIDSINLQNFDIIPISSHINITKDFTKLIALTSNIIRVLDLNNPKNTLILETDFSIIRSFTIFPDDSNKIIITENNCVVVWDLQSNAKISEIKLSCSEIRLISMTSNAKKLAVVDAENNISVLNLQDNQEVKVQSKESHKITKIEFTVDCKKLICIVENKDLNVWETENYEFYGSVELTDTRVLALALTLDNKIIYSCSNKTINIIDTNYPHLPKKNIIIDLNFSITSLAIDFETNLLVFGDENGSLILRDFKTFDIRQEFIDYEGSYSLKFMNISPDFNKIIGQSDSEIIIWDIQTKQQIFKLKNYNKPAFITSDPLDTKIVVIKPNYEIIIWDLNTLNFIGQFNIFEEQEHEISIEVLELNTNKEYVFGCSDGFIYIWDFYLRKTIKILKTNLGKPVKRLLIIPEMNFMIAGNYHTSNYTQTKNGTNYNTEEYDSFNLWDLGSLNILETIKHNEIEEKFTQFLYSKIYQQIIIGTTDSRIYIYDCKKKNQLESILVCPSNSPIISISEMPSAICHKIITIDIMNLLPYISIWNVKLQVICCRIEFQNILHTKFLFCENVSHLAINGFNALDLKNDSILFESKTTKKIQDFFLLKNNYMISLIENDGIQYSSLRQFQNIYEDVSLLKYSIIDYENFKIEDFISKNKLLFPFKFNFLHILAIIGSFEKLGLNELKKENWLTFTKLQIPLENFLHLDFRDETCLDILIDQNNKTVLSYFFNKIFDRIENDQKTTFYHKLKFFSYDFNYAQTSFVHIIDKILDLYGADTEILNKIFELSFITLDSELFCPNLMRSEFREPIYMATTGFGWLVDESKVNEAINRKLSIKTENKNEINPEMNSVLVKCSVVLLKGITNISVENNKIWTKILKLASSNKFYANKTLGILIHYKWGSYARKYFLKEFLVFLFFFLIFLINFIYIFPVRVSMEPEDEENAKYIIGSIIIDVSDLIYFMFYAYREFKQIKLLRIRYFLEFWNYIDIAVLLGAFTTLIMDLSYMFGFQYSTSFKVIAAITFLCLWTRILSYSRGFQGTGFLVRLVMQTIVDMKYFLLMIFLFMIGFASAAFMLQKDFSHSPFYAFNLVYRLILGDYTNYDNYNNNNGYTNYDEILEKNKTLWAGMVIFTLLLSIIMLNLLISIIGYTFGKVLETEKSMRNIELLSVINEIEKNKIPHSKKKKLQIKNVIGDYLICFHNENHFKAEESAGEDIKNEIWSINKVFIENQTEIKNIIEENQREIKKNQIEIKKLYEIVLNSIKKY